MQGASPDIAAVERKHLFGVLVFFSWCDVWRGYWVRVLGVLYIAEYL